MKCVLNKLQLLTIFGLIFLGLGFLGIILAMLGVFYASAFGAYIFVSLAAIFYLTFTHWKELHPNIKTLSVILIAIGFVLLFASYTTPTIFSGRDQGSLAESAIRLSQNHQLSFSFPAEEEFFKIYGPGKALNFPGFSYDQNRNLITQFPLGYASWLGIFYSLLGITGFIVANSLTFFVFLMFFFLTARNYLSRDSSFFALILVATSFIFSWFFKFTLSENLALALLWFGIFEFSLFLKYADKLYLLSAILSLLLLAFTRIEALAFLLAVFIILFKKYGNSSNFWKIFKNKFIFVPSLTALAVYLISLKINLPFYISFAKGFLNSFSPAENKVDTLTFLASSFYFLKILAVYALLHFIIIGAVGVIYLLKEKKYEALVPFFVTLPAFIYLINPSISFDHPWMLRRLVFAVMPAVILYSVLFLDYFFKRKIYFKMAVVFLLLINIPVFSYFLAFSENKDLAEQTKNISANFTENDLVLVDKDAAGNGWAMMSGPLSFLYGKQAVYFFNPKDLGKIDQSRFDNIYLIIPDNNIKLYEEAGFLGKFTPQKEYQIKTEMLDVKTGGKNKLNSFEVELPQKTLVTTYGKIYILQDLHVLPK